MDFLHSTPHPPPELFLLKLVVFCRLQQKKIGKLQYVLLTENHLSLPYKLECCYCIMHLKILIFFENADCVVFLVYVVEYNGIF